MAQSQTEGSAPTAEDRPESPPAIDLEALAERVYRLMREDVRLERAREGQERWR